MEESKVFAIIKKAMHLEESNAFAIINNYVFAPHSRYCLNQLAGSQSEISESILL